MCGDKQGGCCKKGCSMKQVAKLLVVVGGINWGLVGLGMLLGKTLESWNLVHLIFGSMPALEGIVYVLVGLSAVMVLMGCKCKKCIVEAPATTEAPKTTV